MASEDAEHVSPVAFFESHGYFYIDNSEIGQVVKYFQENLSEGKGALESNGLEKYFKPKLVANPDLKDIVKSYLSGESHAFIRSPDPRNFFVSTTQKDNNHAIFYMFGPNTKFEISLKSHAGELKGVRGVNLLEQVPYYYLNKVRRLTDLSVSLKEGGILMAHPRLATSMYEGGLSFGYVCVKSHLNAEGPRK